MPGNTNVPLDDGVRRKISPQGERLASLNGVNNPADGNVNLVGPQGQVQAISIVPDAANHRIVISENHSTKTGNVHGLQATDLQQIGALLASDYDLGKRALVPMSFTNADTTPNGSISKTFPVLFKPRLVLVVGECNSIMGTTMGGSFVREYGGGVSAFVDLEASPFVQQCSGPRVIRASNENWVCSSDTLTGIGTGFFVNLEAIPIQGERVSVTITDVSTTDLTVTITRNFAGNVNTPLSNFFISLRLLCTG